MSVDNRTRALVQALRRASDVRLYISRVEELSYHLLEFPETRLVAVKVRHSKKTKFVHGILCSYLKNIGFVQQLALAYQSFSNSVS